MTFPSAPSSTATVAAPLRPAKLRRLGALGWLQARAFTSTRVAAVAAWFTATLSLTPFMLRRVVFESANGDGLVIMGRRRPTVDALLSTATVLTLYALVGVLTSAISMAFGGILVAVGATMLVLTAVAVLLLLGAVLIGGGLTSSVGPETPPGRYWFIGALAQRPSGVPYSAVFLARRAVQELPSSGDIVVAVAATKALHTQYVSAGFTAGKGRRVYRIQP